MLACSSLADLKGLKQVEACLLALTEIQSVEVGTGVINRPRSQTAAKLRKSGRDSLCHYIATPLLDYNSSPRGHFAQNITF